MGARASEGTCPLPDAMQRRNLLLFAACTALLYLAASVSYVGVTQASLCRQLGASDTVANLPGMAYLALTFSPVLFAWLVPYVGWLKRNLVVCFATASLSQAGVAGILVAPVSAEVQMGAVIVQSAVAGIMAPSAVAFLWEVLGRGTEERRRGLTLSLAFGVGPLFAVVGSLGAQLLLQGSLGPVTLPGLDFPANFAALYLATAPATGLSALLCCLFVVPPVAVEPVREPFVRAVFGGFYAFLGDRILRMATLVTILLYTGNTISSNLNLYSQEVFGEAPMLHAGYQNAARFGFKMAAGLLLGWLLTRTSPRAGLLTTGSLYIISLVLALVATPQTYLLVFGIYGAGELIGVYAPNYILSASRKEEMRRNMSFVTMMMAPAAPAGYLFGWISDHFGELYGKPAGFQISFIVCAALMAAGLLLALITLPARPGQSAPARSEG